MTRSCLNRRSSTVAAVIALAALPLAGCSGDAAVPGRGSSAGLVLPDADTGRLAGIALEAWALARSATSYQLDGCSRSDQATAACVARVEFADNPSNPQICSLGIAVRATAGRAGIKEPTHAAHSVGIENEDYELSNGGYGTYRYGDESECDQAQHLSGF